MNILAFDTCLDKMYVALSRDFNVVDSKTIVSNEHNYHSAYLISTIREILAENSLTPKNIDVLTINIGPGSFTGIRACTTVARAFAQGLGKKTLGVSSLEILSRINASDKPCIVALDARKNMAYTAIYQNKKEIVSPKSMVLEELSQLVESQKYFVVTDDRLQPVLGGQSYQSIDADFGKLLLEISHEKLSANAETDWAKLLPLYIQPPPVTVKK